MDTKFNKDFFYFKIGFLVIFIAIFVILLYENYDTANQITLEISKQIENNSFNTPAGESRLINLHYKLIMFSGSFAIFNILAFLLFFLFDSIEKRNLNDRLKKLVSYDYLTDLPNKYQLIDYLSRQLDEARRYDQKFAVIFLDLDDFKKINESAGHGVGDKVLVEVSKRIKASLRKYDIVSRTLGDKFILVLPNMKDVKYLAQISKRIQTMIAKPVKDAGNISVTASIGISIFPNDGLDSEELIRNSETAMKIAKKEKHNNFRLYNSEMNNLVFGFFDTNRNLHTAIRKKEFNLNFQPICNLEGNISEAEALLRWKCGDKLIPPDVFIPIAEETGMIIPLGYWILKTAFENTKKWVAVKKDFITAINISPIQLKKENFSRQVLKLIKKFEISPSSIALEITEGVTTSNNNEVLQNLKNLYGAGIKIYVDDFGTGFSSMKRLIEFPLTGLKIDRSFVNDIVSNEYSQSIASTVIKLAHNINLIVIAEGVETSDQLDCLKFFGCDEIQGYYFDKPKPALDFEAKWITGDKK